MAIAVAAKSGQKVTGTIMMNDQAILFRNQKGNGVAFAVQAANKRDDMWVRSVIIPTILKGETIRNRAQMYTFILNSQMPESVHSGFKSGQLIKIVQV